MTNPFDILPKNAQPQIRVLAMPADTNSAGDIFGGWLMSHVDIAGSTLAHRIADGRTVTVAVNNLLFLKPVYVGDLVSFYATVDKIGNTSITINVDGYAERKRMVDECEKVVTAKVTYVAIDHYRKPRPVIRDENSDIKKS